MVTIIEAESKNRGCVDLKTYSEISGIFNKFFKREAYFSLKRVEENNNFNFFVSVLIGFVASFKGNNVNIPIRFKVEVDKTLKPDYCSLFLEFFFREGSYQLTLEIYPDSIFAKSESKNCPFISSDFFNFESKKETFSIKEMIDSLESGFQNVLKELKVCYKSN